eukprot:TRINITY_DN3576_c0_g1_i1.p5 TRINITY_DN3576_c0_g1~~TRINITY_DN3576_c0_g1_i1.p5  ORF type:complete len:130 (+),score=33.88 TRINITY_DN3576_c0_g1_i1:522-911(+)
MDNSSKMFFLEVETQEDLQIMHKSALLRLLDLAEQAGASTFNLCVRKTSTIHDGLVRTFSFLGFKKLKHEEQIQKISMTETHSVLVYDFRDELQKKIVAHNKPLFIFIHSHQTRSETSYIYIYLSLIHI